jgi:hypothetical protein
MNTKKTLNLYSEDTFLQQSPSRTVDQHICASRSDVVKIPSTAQNIQSTDNEVIHVQKHPFWQPFHEYTPFETSNHANSSVSLVNSPSTNLSVHASLLQKVESYSKNKNLKALNKQRRHLAKTVAKPPLFPDIKHPSSGKQPVLR